MNYNERGADPQGGVAQNPLVGTESGDLRKIREAIGLFRSILDAQGCGIKDPGWKSQKKLLESYEGSRRKRIKKRREDIREESRLKDLLGEKGSRDNERHRGGIWTGRALGFIRLVRGILEELGLEGLPESIR